MSVGVGILGYGRWGEKLARVVAHNASCRLAAICDTDPARRAQAAAQFPDAAIVSSLDEMLEMKSVTALAIATPPATLAKFAGQAIGGGRHVFLEKPGALTPEEMLALGVQAMRAGAALMIDLTPVFSPLQDALKGALVQGHIGRLASWRAERMNVAYDQPGVDVMRDLAIHDLAVIDSALGRSPSWIAGRDAAFGADGRLREATILLRYADGLVVEIAVSWDGVARTRKTTIVGDAGTVVRDDVENEFHVFASSRDGGRLRQIEDWRASIEAAGEPLARAIDCFMARVADARTGTTDAATTARLLSWIVCAEKSIEANGGFLPLLPEAVA